MNVIKFYSVALGIKHPKVHVMFALFEACTELLPFISILNKGNLVGIRTCDFFILTASSFKLLLNINKQTKFQ